MDPWRLEPVKAVHDQTDTTSGGTRAEGKITPSVEYTVKINYKHQEGYDE